MSKMAEQRAQLLARLRCGPVTVDQARKELGISRPGARIFELRHDLNIQIASIRMGRQAAYVLVAAEAA